MMYLLVLGEFAPDGIERSAALTANCAARYFQEASKSIANPATAANTPAAAPMRGPNGRAFSIRTKRASAETQARIITPNTNRSPINKAQQPKQ